MLLRPIDWFSMQVYQTLKQPPSSAFIALRTSYHSTSTSTIPPLSYSINVFSLSFLFFFITPTLSVRSFSTLPTSSISPSFYLFFPPPAFYPTASFRSPLPPLPLSSLCDSVSSSIITDNTCYIHGVVDAANCNTSDEVDIPHFGDSTLLHLLQYRACQFCTSRLMLYPAMRFSTPSIRLTFLFYLLICGR